jgi:hypothetical protein
MILNILLLVGVFGARKKKINLYLSAALLGLAKVIIYFVFTKNILISLLMGIIFTALASAFVFFLKRLDARKPGEAEVVPMYSTPGSEKMAFRWEYFPLSVLLVVIIFGELVVAL